MPRIIKKIFLRLNIYIQEVKPRRWPTPNQLWTYYVTNVRFFILCRPLNKTQQHKLILFQQQWVLKKKDKKSLFHFGSRLSHQIIWLTALWLLHSAIVAMSKGQSLYPIIQRVFFVCIADSVFPPWVRCNNLPLTFSVGVVDKILHKMLRGTMHRLSTFSMDSIEVWEKQSSIRIWKHPTGAGCFSELFGNKDSSLGNILQLLAHYLGRD